MLKMLSLRTVDKEVQVVLVVTKIAEVIVVLGPPIECHSWVVPRLQHDKNISKDISKAIFFLHTALPPSVFPKYNLRGISV